MKLINHLLPLLVVTTCSPGWVSAQPLMVNYQGRLSQISGAVFPNGPAEIRVRLFDAATGGTQKWDSGNMIVQVRDGVFSTLLQDGSPTLDNGVFTPGVRYFELSVRQALTWTTLQPRQVIASVPWSFWANCSVTVADGAITSSKLADSAVIPQKLASDRASLARVSGGSLHVNGDGNVLLEPGYRLGLGVTGNPASTLQVGGNAKIAGNLDLTGASRITASVDSPAPSIEFHYNNSSTPTAYILHNDLGELHLRVHDGARRLICYMARIDMLGDFVVDDTTPSKNPGGSGANWSITSDARLKRDVEPLSQPLAKLLKLHGVSFEYRDPRRAKGRMAGFIAQDVQKVFPDWVTAGTDGFLQIGLDHHDAYIVEAIREQQNQIESLKAELAREKAARSALERRLGEIERMLKAKR